jgi:hypothetical protein
MLGVESLPVGGGPDESVIELSPLGAPRERRSVFTLANEHPGVVCGDCGAKVRETSESEAVTFQALQKLSVALGVQANPSWCRREYKGGRQSLRPHSPSPQGLWESYRFQCEKNGYFSFSWLPNFSLQYRHYIVHNINGSWKKT